MKKLKRTLIDYLDYQARVSEHKAPLRALNSYTDLKGSCSAINKGFVRLDYSRGHSPYAKMMLFNVLVLQSLYELSVTQREFHIQDHLMFMRFSGLELNHKTTDQNAISGFWRAISCTGSVDRLFSVFHNRMQSAGLLARKGCKVNATFDTALRQRIRCEEKLVHNCEVLDAVLAGRNSGKPLYGSSAHRNKPLSKETKQSSEPKHNQRSGTYLRVDAPAGKSSPCKNHRERTCSDKDHFA